MANVKNDIAANIPSQPIPGETKFKKKYGPRPEFSHSRHSWLTPIIPHVGKKGVEVRDDFVRAREERQRAWFFNFTAKELLDLDANITTTRSLKQSDFEYQVPINPCFHHSRWFARGAHHEPPPLGSLGPGYWVYDNSVVQEIMRPTLQLASLMLENIQNEFYDCITYGPRTSIDSWRVPRDKPNPPELYSFRSRGLNPADPTLQKSKNDMVNWLAKYVLFKFRESSDEPSWNAFTRQRLRVDDNGFIIPGSQIVLNTAYYEALLRPDITSSEKLGYQWKAALTLVHECPNILRKDWVWRGPEPYFENHPLNEFGHLLEHLAFGGPTWGNQNPVGYKFPTIAFFWTEWPTMYYQNYATAVLLKDPPLDSVYHFYPVPVQIFEGCHQLDFWNHIVKAFGTSMIGLKSLASNVRMKWTQSVPRSFLKELETNAWEQQGADWRNKIADMGSKQSMNANERRVCNAGDELIRSAKLREGAFVHSSKQEELLGVILEFNQELKERHEAATAADTSDSLRADLMADIKQGMSNQYVMLLNIATAHRGAVDWYLALVDSRGVSADVHDNLLLFNRAMRAFARQIASKWKGGLKDDYHTIDEILEFRRQMLFRPNLPPTDQRYPQESKENDEIEFLLITYEKLSTDPRRLKKDIYDLTEVLFRQRWESSLYVRTCAEIVKLATQLTLDEAGNPEYDSNRIDANIEVLVRLLNGEGNKPCAQWRETLENIIKRMRVILAQFRPNPVVQTEDEDTEPFSDSDVEMETYEPINEDDIPTDNEDDSAPDTQMSVAP